MRRLSNWEAVMGARYKLRTKFSEGGKAVLSMRILVDYDLLLDKQHLQFLKDAIAFPESESVQPAWLKEINLIESELDRLEREPDEKEAGKETNWVSLPREHLANILDRYFAKSDKLITVYRENNCIVFNLTSFSIPFEITKSNARRTALEFQYLAQLAQDTQKNHPDNPKELITKIEVAKQVGRITAESVACAGAITAAIVSVAGSAGLTLPLAITVAVTCGTLANDIANELNPPPVPPPPPGGGSSAPQPGDGPGAREKIPKDSGVPYAGPDREDIEKKYGPIA
jgi:hypothetical protein